MSKFTKQIEVKMLKDGHGYSTFVCHDGADTAIIPCDEQWCEEIAIRINNHEILFNKLIECARELNGMIVKHNKVSAEKLSFDTVNECLDILERCK